MMNPSPQGHIDLEDPSIRVPGGLNPLVDVWVRDPRVTIGHDGAYYLVGTTRLDGQVNAGARANDTASTSSSENRIPFIFK